MIAFEKMMKISICGLLLFAGCASLPPPPAGPVRFDHLWIVVQPGAPERAALERAGFRLDPAVNRHEGQGTASITAEFQNAFLELIWPDESVPVNPGLERGAEKFRQRSLWRISGWSPIGINLHYAGAAPAPLPVPVWTISLPWMESGAALTMLMPRDDTRSPAMSIHPRPLPVPTDANAQMIRARGDAALLVHPNGVQRVTHVRLIAPRSYQPIAALIYLREQHVIELSAGSEWAVELTFDRGAQGKSNDLRPGLPLLIRY
jgi:hypothetical protein